MEPTNGHHVAPAEAEPSAVREQLERVLASPSFRNSKRHSAFLRFVVDETLNGNAPQLKERTVGAHVFGRDAGYDTNIDPVVRVSAGELRKRVAQYYHQPGTEHEMRIELPPGSYVPEFRPPAAAVPQSEPPQAVVKTYSRRKYLFAVAGAVALLSLVGWLRPWASRSAFTQFWQPVWDSPGTVLIGLPGRQFADQTGRQTPPMVAFSDAVALARLTPILKAKGKTFRVLNQGSTTQADLKAGPAILIGAFSNGLTLRLMSEARFTFERDPETNRGWIKDRQNPTSKQWQTDRTAGDQRADFSDYAMVSRVLDPTTDRITVVAAGISGAATLAAGEFLSNPDYMEAIADQAHGDWSRRNMQVVVAIKVTQMTPGPPRVVATYFW